MERPAHALRASRVVEDETGRGRVVRLVARAQAERKRDCGEREGLLAKKAFPFLQNVRPSSLDPGFSTVYGAPFTPRAARPAPECALRRRRTLIYK